MKKYIVGTPMERMAIYILARYPEQRLGKHIDISYQ